MNIDVNSKVTTKVNSTEVAKTSKADNDGAKFSDELNNLFPNTVKEETVQKEEVKKENISDENNTEAPIVEAIGGLADVVVEMSNKLGHTDENSEILLKDKPLFDDNKLKNEDNSLINNDMNVQELKEALAFQMNASMNFDSNGQAFSDLMENQKKGEVLSTNVTDLAEEKNILSSMDENIAIANRNKALAEAKIKTVTNSEGIKRVDKNTNITVENVVKFDEVIMNKSDVEFFTQLVENGQTELTAENVKSAQISKTLADLIAKSMKDNQPVRIDFDNNISVIIKIGKDGKISADFLPSSQIAEAYLKENLPLLKQRFDENNIEYDSLNRRERKQDEKENQKKGHKDE